MLRTDYLRGCVHSVVADRQCGGVDKARDLGYQVKLIDSSTSPERFCSGLADWMNANKLEWVLSFYTNFYTESFRRRYRDRIINFHPSLLPSFKGMDGFGDGVRYHVKFIGTTVELIKDVMDEGKIFMQTVLPLSPELAISALRHRIFVQQCKTLLQVVRWIDQGRVEVTGDEITIKDARYDDLEFSPALDCNEATTFDVAYKPV